MERPHLFVPSNDVKERKIEKPPMGPGTYPRVDYSEHGKILFNSVSKIANMSIQSSDPIAKEKLFFKLTIGDDYYKNRKKVSESIQGRTSNLKKIGINLVSPLSKKEAYVLSSVGNIETLKRQTKEYALSEGNKGKSYFAFIERIEEITPEEKVSKAVVDKLEEDGCADVLIELFPELEEKSVDKVYMELKKICSNYNGEIKEMFRLSSGNNIIKAFITYDTLKHILNFISVQNVSYNTKFFAPQAFSGEEIPDNIIINDSGSDTIVCLFDSGVDSRNTILAPFIIGYEDRTPHGSTSNTSHGTFVASRIVFGDDIEDQIAQGVMEARARIYDVKLFYAKKENINENESIDTKEIIEIIRDVVDRKHQDIKVYNLSLGGDTCIDDKLVSHLASELDKLAKRYKVLFVISAGNYNEIYDTSFKYPDFLKNNDVTRISSPGEAFCGLTVGSIATKFNRGSMAQYNEPSPFSRRGPGFAGIRKPDIAEHGGNCGKIKMQIPSIFAAGLSNTGNTLAYGCGTSYSAPLISSYASQLLYNYPSLSHNMIKALLIHFAAIDDVSSFTTEEYIKHVGFGVPDIRNALESVGKSATYLYEGQLEKNKTKQIFFRVPSTLFIGRKGKKVTIKATVVYDPYTDKGKYNQYSHVHVYASIRKLNLEGDLTKSTSYTGISDCKDKFSPVVCFSSSFQNNVDSGEWCVELWMQTRWISEENYMQDYALIITVEDPHNEVDVYNSVLIETGNRYKDSTRIKVR